jgi:hypothetical protein
LAAVDSAVKNVDESPSTANPNSFTANKASIYAETVNAVDDVDKNAFFGEGWADASDEEIPPEFLTPTTPPALQAQ